MNELLVQLFDRVAELERCVARLIRVGKVDSVDKGAGTVQVRLPSGLVIGPMRWAVLSGQGAWIPPEVGDQAIVLAPGGNDGLLIALAGIGTGAGKGDKYVMGAGTTKPPALAEPVVAELNKVIAALDAVSAGGNAFTGANTYKTVGEIAASKTEVE